MYQSDNAADRTGQRFEVHVETLEKSAETLDGLADLIQLRMIDPMRQSLSIGNQPKGAGVDSEASYIFGKFEAAQAVAAKYQAHYDAAHTSAQNMLQSLRDAAEGTRQMAKRYRDAEQASKARVQDINQMLAAGATAKDPESAPDPNAYQGSLTYQTAAAPAPAPSSPSPAPSPAPAPAPAPAPSPAASPAASPSPSPSPSGTQPGGSY